MTSPAPLPAVEDVIAQHHSRETPSSVVLYGAGILLLFGPLAFGATTAAPLFVLQAGSALLCCVWIVQLAKPGPQQIWLNPLFWPILAFGVLIAIQLTTGRTVARGQTLSAAGLFATYGLLCFLLVQSFRRSRQVEVIARAVTIYGAAVALFALLQDASSNGKLYWVQPSEGWIYGPYSNHNHYAGLMEMLTPVPLVIALSSRTSRQTRWLAGMAASIMAASLLLSGSRGGMTAFAAEMVLLAILLRRQRMDAKTMGVMAASLVLALVLFGWLAQPQLTERLAAIPSGTKAELSGGTRLTIDRDTLRMFAQRPLLGWGLGSFPDVYPRFCSFYATLPVDRAHNDYLQLLAEMGIAGFAITMYSLFIALRGALRKIQQDPLGTNGLIGLSVLLGISGILVHSLLDFNLEIPANAAIFYALCTVAAMERRFGRHRHRHLRG